MPIGVVLMVGAWLALPRTEDLGPKRALDIFGAITVTGGLAVLVYGIVSTDVYPWGSVRTIFTISAGLGLLAIFFLNEARFARDPLVPLGIFRRRSLSVANGIAVTIGSGLFGTYFFLSLYLQDVNGYSALRTGLAFLPAGLCTLAGALIGTRLVQVIGARRQLMLGPGLAAGGLFWLSTIGAGDAYLSHVLGPLVLIGIGLGMSFVPMTLSATAGVPPRRGRACLGSDQHDAPGWGCPRPCHHGDSRHDGGHQPPGFSPRRGVGPDRRLSGGLRYRRRRPSGRRPFGVCLAQEAAGDRDRRPGYRPRGGTRRGRRPAAWRSMADVWSTRSSDVGVAGFSDRGYRPESHCDAPWAIGNWTNLL